MTIDEEFKQVVERFLAAADKGDHAALATTYGPDFQNIHVADDGGLAGLTGAQILAILRASEGGNHCSPVRETILHSLEICGDLGYVLMTRIKNYGRGWEPVFHSLTWRLVWDETGGKWMLLREFIHQRAFACWA